VKLLKVETNCGLLIRRAMPVREQDPVISCLPSRLFAVQRSTPNFVHSPIDTGRSLGLNRQQAVRHFEREIIIVRLRSRDKQLLMFGVQGFPNGVRRFPDSISLYQFSRHFRLSRHVALTIARGNGEFTQADIERVLARVYDAERMASMVLNRYPHVPVIMLFTQTISEATMAHFAGLHHIAVGGLIPVVEGAGRLLANERGLDGSRGTPIGEVFRELAAYAKDDVIARRIGATEEIVNMLDSFLCFIADYFFSDSQRYPLTDGTNRARIPVRTRRLSRWKTLSSCFVPSIRPGARGN
jgi:hypothetical protein